MRENIDQSLQNIPRTDRVGEQNIIDLNSKKPIGAPPNSHEGLAGQDYDSLTKMATQAAERGEWHAALNAWKCLCQLDPQNPVSYLGLAEAYRGLGDATAADNALFAYSSATEKPAEFLVSFALNAQINEDWQEALLRWQAAKISHPNAAVIWAGEAAMLQLLGRLEEADAVTCAGTRIFPNHIDIYAQHCNVALAAGKWLDAETRWHAMATRFLDHFHVRETASQFENAIEAGISAMTDETLCREATTAQTLQLFSRAARLWGVAYKRNARLRENILGYGYALREDKQFDLADEVFLEGIGYMADDVELHANYAQVAAIKRDWSEAAKRWEAIIEKFSTATQVWVMAAAAYRQAGWLRQADDLLERAIAREPERAELFVHHAMTAEMAGDWLKAVKSWDIAHRLRPEDLNIQNSRGDAIWQATLSGHETSELVAAADAHLPAQLPDVDSAMLKKIALNFEGLGDNCEFGIVQRRFGAEPIGLFRFAAINVKNLIFLAQEQFEPLGNPEFITLDLTEGNEFLIRDKRNNYFMHSFVNKASVDVDKFLQQQIQRLKFLKRELMEDLRAGEKIFVFKSTPGISHEDILQLHAAICSFGENRLLVVQKSHGAHVAGTVENIKPNLFAGYVDTIYEQADSQIDFESWKRILRTVYGQQPRRSAA